MVEIHLKVDPLRLGWYLPEETQSPSQSSGRWRIANRSHIWRPPTDVYEIDTALIVRVEIAGMQEEDFSISLSGRHLVIRGLRADVSERRAYHQMEIYFGEFMSEIELPCPVVVGEVSAEYNLGFLRLILPKGKPQRIQIT